jgi:3-hydroxybutyryl-CoA dehydratase
MQVGDKVSRSKTFTDEDVRTFAQISGDANPLHLDDIYAATTDFGQRIVHGMFVSSLISATIATELPGTLYLNQSLKFKAPVFIGDTVTALVEVLRYREERRLATLSTTCVKQDGTIVIEGEALVLAP